VLVERKRLLDALMFVASGLDKEGMVEQSSHFIFGDGMVSTYSDSVSCSAKSPLDIDCVVLAEPLLALVRRLPDSLEIEMKDEGLSIKSGRKRGTVKVEQSLKTPITKIEKPVEWKKLPKGFTDAVDIVRGCAGTDNSVFLLTCVNFTKRWVEASDGYQVCRYPIDLPINTGMVVRSASLKFIAKHLMVECSETENWLHLRNQEGQTVSCRRFVERYPSNKIDAVLNADGMTGIELAEDLSSCLKTCQIFSSDSEEGNLVEVRLKKDKLRLEGRGKHGSYSEVLDTKYDGSPLRFRISPSLLEAVTRKKGRCEISDSILKVVCGAFTFATATLPLED